LKGKILNVEGPLRQDHPEPGDQDPIAALEPVWRRRLDIQNPVSPIIIMTGTDGTGPTFAHFADLLFRWMVEVINRGYLYLRSLLSSEEGKTVYERRKLLVVSY
jgi:hypothetical protein